jgi:hypothetical protein
MMGPTPAPKPLIQQLQSRDQAEADSEGYKDAKEEILKIEKEEGIEVGPKLYRKGSAAVENKNWKQATQFFRATRKRDEDYLPAWFNEIRALKELKNEKEVKKVSDEFLSVHPQFKNLPMFQKNRLPASDDIPPQ